MKSVFSGFRMDRKIMAQFLLVFGAFFLMVLIGSIFGARIVSKNVASYGTEVVNSTLETLKAYLSESQITLNNVAFSIERLKITGASVKKMQNEVISWTSWTLAKKERLASFSSAYGVVDGSYIDGTFWVPEDDYIPEQRPWYIGALRANGDIFICDPYIDEQTGKTVLTLSKQVYDESREAFGVIAIDIFLDTLDEYVSSLRLMDSGYGILTDTQRVILVHRDESVFGTQLEYAPGGYAKIASRLATGQKVEAFFFDDYDGSRSVAFFGELFNRWHVGIIAPRSVYYRDIYSMVIFLSIAGFVLMVLLCFILAYLHAQKNRSDEASRIKSSFLANMSHEIRTPMNAIIGMTDLLLNEPLSQKQKNFVSDISVSANNLLAIINDILDLSKIESGKLELNPVDYDFPVFIDNIASVFKFVAQKKDLDFIFESEGEPPKCLYGDDIRLRQVLTNICGNAVKFTSKGHIRLKSMVLDDTMVFRIEDTGMGIRKEDLPKLFNPFAQADAQRNRNIVGTGLGLSISKNFVEMMGGTITVDSVYGQRTAFIVTIPKVMGNESAIRKDDDVKKDKRFSAPNAKILVVDDNDVNLKVARGLLEMYQIHVVTVLSGKEAIMQVKENRFDIVFMDHMMPEMDGVEATAEIRRLGGKYKQLVIIALTANAVHGAKEMFIANGFDDFISKPIDIKMLGEMLRTWLPPEKIVEAETAVNAPAEGVTGDTESFVYMLRNIEGINTKIGLSRVSGMEDMYRETVELFYKKITSECDKMDAFLSQKDLHNLAISVHGMKSTLSTIGAMRLSDDAQALETAAKGENVVFCEEHLPELLTKLRAMREKLSELFPEKDNETERPVGDPLLLKEYMKVALEAADELDGDACIELLDRLLAFDYGPQTNELLETAKNACGDFDFSAACEALNQIGC